MIVDFEALLAEKGFECIDAQTRENARASVVSFDATKRFRMDTSDGSKDFASVRLGDVIVQKPDGFTVFPAGESAGIGVEVMGQHLECSGGSMFSTLFELRKISNPSQNQNRILEALEEAARIVAFDPQEKRFTLPLKGQAYFALLTQENPQFSRSKIPVSFAELGRFIDFGKQAMVLSRISPKHPFAVGKPLPELLKHFGVDIVSNIETPNGNFTQAQLRQNLLMNLKVRDFLNGISQAPDDQFEVEIITNDGFSLLKVADAVDKNHWACGIEAAFRKTTGFTEASVLFKSGKLKDLIVFTDPGSKDANVAICIGWPMLTRRLISNLTGAPAMLISPKEIPCFDDLGAVQQVCVHALREKNLQPLVP